MKQYIHLHTYIHTYIHTYVHKFLPNRSPPFMGSGSSTSPLPVSSKLIFISATIIVAYTHKKRSKYINLPYQPYYIHAYILSTKENIWNNFLFVNYTNVHGTYIHLGHACIHTYIITYLFIYIWNMLYIHTHTYIHYLKSS